MAFDPDPVLPERSADDADSGWGESSADDAREAWLCEQRPPHHGG